MELVLKLPKDKLPFIGVCFEKETEASRLNKELLDIDQYHNFEIILEQGMSGISLDLKSLNPYKGYLYRKLKFDANDLRAWLINTKNEKAFHFGHVFKEHGNHIIAKRSTDFKNFVIKVHQLKVYE